MRHQGVSLLIPRCVPLSTSLPHAQDDDGDDVAEQEDEDSADDLDSADEYDEDLFKGPRPPELPKLTLSVR